MAEEATSQEAAAPVVIETRNETIEPTPVNERIDSAAENSANPSEPAKEVASAPTVDVALEQPAAPATAEPGPLDDKPEGRATPTDKSTNKQPILEQPPTEDKPATTQEDDMANETEIKADDAAVGTEASANKSTKARRKSGGIPEHKNKKLNRKSSKAKMTHIDAKPGEYFMIRLKGYPLWPGIVCDESMLPQILLKSRPVTAARPDGTYREDYADGGARVNDRTFPVMYLHTNEFSWIPNTDLVDMDMETVGNVTGNMRKDLAAAHVLASEQHELDYFKDILKTFMAARAAELEAKEAAKEAAKAAKQAEKAQKTEKASKPKRKSKAAVEDDADGDVEMEDAFPDVDSEGAEVASSDKKKNKKKRKASDDGEDSSKTDSVKKPKTTIKFNVDSTPKSTSGTSTSKPTKDTPAKAAKPKPKKATAKAKETSEEITVPTLPEPTPEEKRVKKEKEIMFLRHKLQKGVLTKDQTPKEEEMSQMSEFISKLEGYADLEVSIIRATKINKVLKAILKVPIIPKEDEFQFKPRSQNLLDKWNKLLASEHGTPVAAAPPTAANGVNEDVKPEGEDAKGTPTTTNGTKESSTEEKVEETVRDTQEPAVESKDEACKVEDAPAPSVEEPAPESKVEPTPVESSA